MGKQQSSNPSSNRWIAAVLETLGGPLLWGMIASFAFYFCVHRGLVQHPLVVRYTAGHPVEYVEVTLFFVGLMAILGRARQILGQLLAVRAVKLRAPDNGTLTDQVSILQQQLDKLPGRWRSSRYAQRLAAALGHLQRRNSASHLDDELKYLADLDAERSHDSYALVRIIIWATPMLGFLGTVIGITLALGDLSPEALVNSPKEAMEGLLSGLSVAFDTTALALTLSIVLMFAQFLTQQVDAQLQAAVDRHVVEDLGPIFRHSDVSSDPQVATLHEMARAMMQSMEQNARRQTDVWQHALQMAEQRWAEAMAQAGATIHDAVAGGVRGSLHEHTENLVRLEEAAGRAASEHWQQWHLTASDTLKQLRDQQAELQRHGQILAQALQATGEVVNLEKALNQNLRALAGAKNFEDTVMSLSAAIHLLSSRLSKPMPRDAQVKLEVNREERAA